MAKSRGNSLSNSEVAIIKALIAAKTYSNQQIAGLINRARGDAASDISTGRISNIKNDQIKAYIAIAPAGAGDVAKFLAMTAPAVAGGEAGPMTAKRLAELLPIRSQDPLSLDITETDQVECKKSFNFIMKTIAAFANNKGGYFLFGVENGTFNVVGLNDDKFEKYDLNKLNQHIRNQLGIGIEISMTTYLIGGKKIGVAYVAPAHTKPVIFAQDADGASQGHIYYRYPGEDRLISSADLQRLIELRIQQLSETVLSKHISNILRFGIESAAVMNLNTGEIDGKAGSFVIDEGLLPQISFIKEGEFVEKSGAPALKLIGELAATKATGSFTMKEAVELYPLTYDQIYSKIRKATGAKQGVINSVIKVHDLKRNTQFAYFAFRSNADRVAYDKSGKLKKNTASIYNEKAASFLIDEVQKALAAASPA